MQSVLILGGCGFIGSAIAKALLKSGQVVVTLADNGIRGRERSDLLREEYSDDILKIIDIDLTDATQYSLLGRGYDFVYMMAAILGVGQVNTAPHEVIRVNSLSLVNSLEWLKQAGCGRAIFASSSETYAGAVEAFDVTVPTPEDVPLAVQNVGHPRFSYAITKMLGESGFINYAAQGFFEAVVVRYHNVYGPMMGFRHVIPNLAERFFKGEKPFQIYGHNQTRSFNHIDDAVAGTILAAERGHASNIYHIGDSDEISIEELTRFVGSLFEYSGEFEMAETFPGSVSRRCPDITKAESELGYRPRVSWQEGVRQTIGWYRKHLGINPATAESFYGRSKY